ncbi:dimethyladenosine transferase [Candidatus Koribacter versatilis Ellin345]|uniref:Ribosomal RNA small subunit methyltransferase A n=1 Tax=Koribacter versatilis (strain Ellin345) TaxID=204669 RepID=RSMA_KORVE|nr:16S rRNA (adenine(1518)-N(6)/adenine(1519)-N(6))-dimethyltransferase RsmA [Candidatus Koribacter versatilis]Q1ILA1.1 RecName: Full=Ribosomal RNA small subunit methyltransferase A; AltName: Full=16S rRNA (adenine(1518)-N(6)/adenine(1519)-N(6))-dimethyltransferase; AltName: Full=16S rRNA dimethyladenosine transferase; AltName: Full=16S rRNA dimethylase; AltName: Full=S-adenosylmethionine-6-N', N'-adenosyl(rRNA) dimethyltransferase [Candidatus Koribacter versatilis Ellin345]ABF42349.1 dimethylade
MPKMAAEKNSKPAKKAKLGQNFLSDASGALKIVEALGDISDATVVEIGPGRGAITDHLAKRAKRLIAVEIDRVLAAQLRLRYSRLENVEILEADILAVELSTVLAQRIGPLRDLRPTKPEKVRIIGNLPYYITSDILLRLFEAHALIDFAVIMVQKEVADRIAAKPGTRDYGLLSATSQLYTHVEKLFTLPPGSFNPAPQVHSTVLKLQMEPKLEALGVDEEGFDSFLKLIFGQKRKTLFNNLRVAYDMAKAREAMKAVGLKSDVRAEAVALEKTAQLYNELRKG